MKIGRILILAALAWCGSAATAAASTILFHVSVNTLALVTAGTPPKPFALDFQLSNGGLLTNTATITNFTFGGGSATSNPAPSSFGASGSLGSSVTLNDALDPFSEFYQGFNPGTSLGFDVALTTNVNTPTPDAFSFFILNSALEPLATSRPDNAIVLLNIDRPNPTIGNIQIGTSTQFGQVSVTSVPEPTTLALLATGLVVVLVRRRS